MIECAVPLCGASNVLPDALGIASHNASLPTNASGTASLPHLFASMLPECVRHCLAASFLPRCPQKSVRNCLPVSICASLPQTCVRNCLHAQCVLRCPNKVSENAGGMGRIACGMLMICLWNAMECWWDEVEFLRNDVECWWNSRGMLVEWGGMLVEWCGMIEGMLAECW